HGLRCSTEVQSTPMTVHAGGGRLVCHHCGHRQSRPLACPDCASLALQPQGVGTERLEELLAERFAGWPVLRIDRGTTARRDGLQKLLAELGDKPGILVGTQILRSEEHTSELQSRENLVCRLLLEKKNIKSKLS